VGEVRSALSVLREALREADSRLCGSIDADLASVQQVRAFYFWNFFPEQQQKSSADKKNTAAPACHAPPPRSSLPAQCAHPL
jgi:hypothetical protein